MDANTSTNEYEVMFDDKSIITSYSAAAYAGQLDIGEKASNRDQFKAWSYLIGTGEAHRLQDWFWRSAKDLLNAGFISERGKANWDRFNEFEKINEKSKITILTSKRINKPSKVAKPKAEPFTIKLTK